MTSPAGTGSRPSPPHSGRGAGLAVDIGSSMGFTTYSVFRERPTVCVDVDAGNLRWHRDRVAAVPGALRPLCVVALATALPLKQGVARYVPCSEVLAHLDDDARVVSEIARVLAPGERAVVTVSYPGLGFTSFLERRRHFNGPGFSRTGATHPTGL
jgi:SAM-dependent methyltransferase